MSESITIPHHRPARRDGVRAHYLFVSALLALIIGGLGYAIVASTVDAVRAGISDANAIAEPVVEYPARELPAEWRWEPKGVEFEHMYRQKASPRIDWIRQGGRR